MLFTLLCGTARAQTPTDSLPDDPGAIRFVVTKMQDISFGAFSRTGSGTITISNTGIRSATGSVTLLSLGASYYQAIFAIEAPSGTVVTILNGPDVTLTGSNGGTATLQLGNSNPASPFATTATPPATNPVGIGGTLTVSGSSPPGTYSGTFSVTFNYQ